MSWPCSQHPIPAPSPEPDEATRNPPIKFILNKDTLIAFLSSQMSVFDLSSVLVKFVVDKVALWQFLSQYFRFRLSASFHHYPVLIHSPSINTAQSLQFKQHIIYFNVSRRFTTVSSQQCLFLKSYEQTLYIIWIGVQFHTFALWRHCNQCGWRQRFIVPINPVYVSFNLPSCHVPTDLTSRDVPSSGLL
jgi:hypothetical protein